MRAIYAWGLVFAALSFTVSGARADARRRGCTGEALTAEQKQVIVDYLRKKFKLPSGVDLKLVNATPVRDSCYRELSFEGKSEIRTWQVTLYASPDLRFLSGELFDTQLDPEEEERARSEAVLKGLTERASASRGPADAPVTIVEFSDFQCPFCRKFAETLEEALAGLAASVRVVFHHLPLNGHDWARQAAEGAACAQLQNGEAFWAIHDQLFRNQASITRENIRDKLSELARSEKAINLEAFERCLSNGMSVGLVLKDMSLAEANHVNSTPTVFINGRAAEGVGNPKRLRELIEGARKEAAAGAPKPALRSAVPNDSMLP